MFKSNPLNDEFELYRKNNAQTAQVNPFSIKQNNKNYNKSYLQTNHHHFSQVRKSNLKNIRYGQFNTMNQNLSAFTERNFSLSEDKKQKCKFKTRNSVINDNYLQKDQIIAVNHQIQKNKTKGMSVKKSVYNPETEKSNQIYQEPIYSPHRSRNTSGKAKANICHINIGEISNSQQSVSNKPLNQNSQIKNHLKSTLYQSIDLKNIFEKIESNMDPSQKINSSQLYSNKESFSPDFTNTVTKKTQIRRIQVNQHELKDPISQNKFKINKFNLKSLIEKNGTANNNTICIKIPDKSLFKSYTSRTQNPELQTKNLPHQIQGINQIRQQGWIPSKTKKSIAILMNDNGIFKQKTSGLRQNEVNSFRISMKISNLRQMMKDDQLDFS